MALSIFLQRCNASGTRVGGVGYHAMDTPVLPSGEYGNVIADARFGAVADALIFRSLAPVAPGLKGSDGDVEVFARTAFVEVFDRYLHKGFVTPETGGWKFGGLHFRNGFLGKTRAVSILLFYQSILLQVKT